MASYPASWRPFLHDVFLHREGGYVRTGVQETLFGITDENWASLLRKVPQAEINAQPESSRLMLEKIRHCAPKDRMKLTHEWMREIGRETAAFGNRKQPEKGIPFQSKEWASASGNKTLVAATQELSLGIIYREYLVGGGFGQMPVSQNTLYTVIDAGARHGVAAAWAMATKSLETIGKIDHGESKKLGWIDSRTLAHASTYREGHGGFNYTTAAGRRAVAAAMQGMTPAQETDFFDAYGFWRRCYITNQPNKGIVEGELARIDQLHPDRGARLREALAGSHGGHDGSARAAVTVPAHARAAGAPILSAEVQTAIQTGSPADFGSTHVAVELPNGRGVFHYALGANNSVGTVINLPEGVQLLRPGQAGLGITNRYADAVLLVWRTGDGKVETFPPIGPNFNAKALALDTASSAFRFDLEGQNRLAPQYSVRVMYTGAPGEKLMWAESPKTALFSPTPLPQEVFFSKPERSRP